MKKQNKKTILTLSVVTTTTICSSVLLFHNLSKTNTLDNNKLDTINKIREDIFIPNDFNDINKYNKSEKIIKKESFNFAVNNKDTNWDYEEERRQHSTNFNIFKNKVNEKYLEYVKLDFEHKYSISNAHTKYNGLISEKNERLSQLVTFNDTNLTKKGVVSLNKINPEININNINYPFKYARQIFGTINAKTDGFKTVIDFKNAANLPLQGNEYAFYVQGGDVIDSNGNYSSISENDISMRITNSNVGVVGINEKTTLNNYQMVINKKITGRLNISLDPNSNNTDMNTTINIVNNSPVTTSISANLNNDSWTVNISGRNLPLEIDKYRIRIDNSNDIGNIKLTGTNSNVNLTFNHKLTNNQQRPIILVYVKGEWLWKNVDNFIDNTSPENSTNPQDFLMNQYINFSTVDSQENPAGVGDFKYSTNIEGYRTDINFDNSVDINLIQILRYGIRNDIFDWARYLGGSLANFNIENSIMVTYPKLDSLFDYLTKKVASKSFWDNEFYYGEREMKQSNKNINELLFASKSEKESLLTDFYNKVFRNVFGANSNTHGYKIGDFGESAHELYIYEPASWKVQVRVKDDSCYLKFSYTYFDGEEKSFEYPFRTKLFLNNLDKQNDDYSKWDLRIIKKDSNIDVSQTNDERLYYADVFYNLFDNYEGSKKLYESIVSYKDQTILDSNVKLIETLFTKKQFIENISRLNLINLLKKDRMIYFTTTNEKGEQYNSWSDLAKGNFKFNIEIGNDFKNFYLKNNWTNINKYTYTFTNFKTQYDIYYNEKANQDKLNIELKGFEDKNVENVTIDWIIDNLIVFDNRSANSIENIRISGSSSEGDDKILATNLLKEDFIKLVLQNKQNINILNKNKANGTFTIEVTLPNLGDDPAKYKNKKLISKNKTAYSLLTNQTNKKLIFNISGLQKYYDLQYNFERSNINAKQVNINTSIEQIENEINDPQSSLDFLKKIISFDWYNETTRDPNFHNKLLKTRLQEQEFFKKIKPMIEKNNNKGQNGLNSFSGIYFANLVFGGTEEQKQNAIKYNLSESNPTTFERVTTNKIPFSIFNLKRNMFFELSKKFMVSDQGEYLQFSIDSFKQQIPSNIQEDIENGSEQFINILDNSNLIGYRKSINDDANVLFNTNALSKTDLIDSIKERIIQFENVSSVNEKGTLKFDLVINPMGGKVNSTTNLLKFKIELINLKKSSSDFDNITKIKSITLDEFNKICKTNYSYATQVNKEEILDNLIYYADSNESMFKDNIFIFKTTLTKEQLKQALLDNSDGFQLNIQSNEQVIFGQMIFNKQVPINGILKNSILFKITGFKGKANTNWKISNNDVLDVGDYNNKSRQVIDDFNEDFIYSNMISFKENVSRNINTILDNSYLTKEEFMHQLNPKIYISKESDRVKISIITNRKEDIIRNNKYDSINFYVNGFSSKGWFEKHKDKLFWTTTGVIITTILTFGTIGIIKKLKKKKTNW